MRPDVEDYAEIDEQQQAGGSRAMSWMVLTVAVGGFAALAYYAYRSGGQTSSDDEVLTIAADDTPIRQAPENAQGEQFANKDKTIYDVIAPDGSVTVEKLLPDSERPLAAENIEDSEDNLPVTKTAAATLATVASTPIVTPLAAATARPDVPEDVTSFVAPAPLLKKSGAAPEMINEKRTVATSAESPLKPTVKSPSGGAYMLQLGAFKSQAEAQAAWKRISAAHSDILGGAPIIVKAELPNGTFYRLRSGVYASLSAAKAACVRLGSQACFPVK